MSHVLFSHILLFELFYIRHNQFIDVQLQLLLQFLLVFGMLFEEYAKRRVRFFKLFCMQLQILFLLFEDLFCTLAFRDVLMKSQIITLILNPHDIT